MGMSEGGYEVFYYSKSAYTMCAKCQDLEHQVDSIFGGI